MLFCRGVVHRSPLVLSKGHVRVSRYTFGDPSSITWRVIVWTSSFLPDFDRFSPKLPWRSKSINTIFNRVLEASQIHIWCKFGDHCTKTWRVILRTTNLHGRTDGRTDNSSSVETFEGLNLMNFKWISILSQLLWRHSTLQGREDIF